VEPEKKVVGPTRFGASFHSALGTCFLWRAWQRGQNSFHLPQKIALVPFGIAIEFFPPKYLVRLEAMFSLPGKTRNTHHLNLCITVSFGLFDP
jgi:hypothetical protein